MAENTENFPVQSNPSEPDEARRFSIDDSRLFSIDELRRFSISEAHQRRFSIDDPPRFLNISDLRLELQTVDALQNELSQIRQEFRDYFLESISECKKVTQELANVDDKDDFEDENSYEIPEKKTVRQLLEELAVDMKKLKGEIKDIKVQSQNMERNLTEIIKSNKTNQTMASPVKIPEIPLLPTPLIRFANKESNFEMGEEDWAILKEINLIKSRLESSIKDGKTLEGTSFSEFSAAIPKNHEATLAFEFTNYLNEPLSNPQCWFNYGSEQTPLLRTLAGHTREAFGFHSQNLTCVNALFSYDIGARSFCLVICIYVHSIGNTVLAVAILPKNVVVNKELENSLWNIEENKSGAKRCPGTSGGELMLMQDDLRVRVALTRGPRARMRIEILSSN